MPTQKHYAYLGEYRQELAQLLDNLTPTTLVAIVEDLNTAIEEDHATSNDTLLLHSAYHALARNVGDTEARRLTENIFEDDNAPD